MYPKHPKTVAAIAQFTTTPQYLDMGFSTSCLMTTDMVSFDL